MSGIFGAASKKDCVAEVFFGTDYHSHLGTRRGGIAIYGDQGFQRSIHSIENSPFRTKFEREMGEYQGNLGIGCISDSEPQPVLVRAAWGSFALVTVGRVNNIEALAEQLLRDHRAHFFELSGGRINQTELIAALIARKDSIVEGIHYAQSQIDGSISLLALTPEGVYAARDIKGRTPLLIGSKQDAYCASFENFAYFNLGYKDHAELGPGEIVLLTPDGVRQMRPPENGMSLCAFLWIYFGYPTSSYEGVNVETMRYRCGSILAEGDTVAVDSVCGVPDSGTAHAIGYANARGLPFTRPLIKYTPTWPRSFMPQRQELRSTIAKMKLVPVDEQIRGKRLLVVDDSVVRGTQIRETMTYLQEGGAKQVHMRAACPPILFGCRYLNFSRSNTIEDLVCRQVIKEQCGSYDPPADTIARYLDGSSPQHGAMERRLAELIGIDSVHYQSVEGMTRAIGIGNGGICTYCMNGVE